jgi:drug/metabolite transporter (DMT)-like permease
MAASCRSCYASWSPSRDGAHRRDNCTQQRLSTLAASRHPLAHALPAFLAAGLMLSSLDATAKYLVQGHAVLLVVWARYAGQLVVVTPFAWHRAGAGFWRSERLGLQLLRSTLLFGATACFFAGLRYLPLAEGSAITFLAPVFIVVLSGPMLHERPTRARWLAVLAGLAGTLLLLRPGSAVFHPAALLLIAAAMCNALYQTLTRMMQRESAYTSLFYSAVVGAAVTTFALPWIDVGPIDAQTLVLFAVAGLCAGLGHYLLIIAYLRAPASLLTPFTYLQMVWATTYGFVLFNQLPDGWSFAGMMVVIAGGILLAHAERRNVTLPKSPLPASEPL